MPWFDACLTARLPDKAEAKLKAMPTEGATLAPLLGDAAQPAAKFTGDIKTAVWLPNAQVAKAWAEYVKDGNVSDSTPPPSPTHVKLAGNELTWQAEADLESGIASFIIERDGAEFALIPEKPVGVVGRQIFQKNGYSDTPTPPLMEMRFTDSKAMPDEKHTYRVITVNSVGLKSNAAAATN
jgi:hypothetical protein